MRIDDGFQTTVDFDLLPSVHFWEKTVTPPTVSAGGSNDITTMRNKNWRTFAPKKLISLEQMKLHSAYDPQVYNDAMNMIGRIQKIFITFPDGTTMTIWGWIDSLAPGDLAEGTQPTMDITVIPSNTDNTGAEVGLTMIEGVAPVYKITAVAASTGATTRITWEASATQGVTYKLQRRNQGTPTWTDVDISAIPAGQTFFDDDTSAIPAGTVVEYQMQAVKGTAKSSWRNVFVTMPDQSA